MGDEDGREEYKDHPDPTGRHACHEYSQCVPAEDREPEMIRLQDLLERLKRLEKEALTALEKVENSEDLAAWRSRYL